MNISNKKDRNQIVLTSDSFFFQIGDDPTQVVPCKLIDVFHKRIYAKAPDNRRARVVSFIYETTNFSEISVLLPNLNVKTWVLCLTQPTSGSNYIGGTMELYRWYSESPSNLHVEDNFETTFEANSSFNPDTGFNALNPYDMIKSGQNLYAPINVLRNQKVIGQRTVGVHPVDSRLLVLYRPVVYKVAANFRESISFGFPFFALGYESYRPYETGLSKVLSIITNPLIKETFQ